MYSLKMLITCLKVIISLNSYKVSKKIFLPLNCLRCKYTLNWEITKSNVILWT